jgi:hypothetical protein
MTTARAFRGLRFPVEVILWAVRWFTQFPVSYRDLEAMLADRGVAVDPVSLYRWVQRFAPDFEKRLRRHLRPYRGSMARRRDLRPRRRGLALPLPCRRRHGADRRLPAQRQARQGGGRALPLQGAGLGQHLDPAGNRHRPAEELPRRAARDEA